MPALSVQSLAHVASAVYRKVDKQTQNKRLNSKRRPWLEFLISIMKSTTLEGGALAYKNTVESSLAETTWVGDDEIEASEPDFQLDLSFGYFNFNIAVKILHDELKQLGFTIMPNGEGTLEDRAMSKSEGLKLINYVKKLVEEASDAYDRRLDLLLHRSGSQSTTVQPGLLGLLTLTNTTGNVGGKARASYASLQHYVKTSMTVTAAGTFRADLDRAIRRANLYSHNMGVPGTVDRIFAGEAWIEGYKAWAELNNYNAFRDFTELKKIDISIPDGALQYEGIPVIHDPTLEVVDTIDTFSPTCTKMGVLINSQTWQFRNETGLHKFMSSPDDPPKQRLTRQDLDGTYSLGLDAPASNALTAIA